MSERGSVFKRRLDFWLGVPLSLLTSFLRVFEKNRQLIADLKNFETRNKHRDSKLKIGIISFGAIGDLLLATGLIRGLQHCCPLAKITLIGSKSNKGAFVFLPEGILCIDFKITAIPELISYLRKEKFDILIDSSQWARLSSILSALSGSGLTVGFKSAYQLRSAAYDIAVLHSSGLHEKDNFLHLGQALFPELSAEPGISFGCSPEAEKVIQGTASDYIFLHMWPSGYKSWLKEWEPKRWASLAKLLMKDGYKVALTGGPADLEKNELFINKFFKTENISANNNEDVDLDIKMAGLAAQSISPAQPAKNPLLEDFASGNIESDGSFFKSTVEPLNLAGKLPLEELACLFKKGRGLISVNTGTMHLGALCGCPTLTLNGPTSAMRWGPIGERAKSLNANHKYSGCLNLGFEYPDDMKDSILNTLSVEEVYSAFKGLLES